MISVTATTHNYILQPTLIDKHKKTLEWISATVLWKSELVFFQKQLDQHAHRFITEDTKKKADHFQNLILYYRTEVVNSYSLKLRLHEKKLADMLESLDETKTEYFSEHDELMQSLEQLKKQFATYKDEFFAFLQGIM